MQVRFCDILWPTSWHLKYLIRNLPFTGSCWSLLYNLSVKWAMWKHMGDQKDPALLSPLSDQIIDMPPAWWPPSWQPGSSGPAHPFPREWRWELPSEWIFQADAHWKIWRQSEALQSSGSAGKGNHFPSTLLGSWNIRQINKRRIIKNWLACIIPPVFMEIPRENWVTPWGGLESRLKYHLMERWGSK